MIHDLLAKTGGKALAYHSTFARRISEFPEPLPSLANPELSSLPVPSVLLPSLPDVTLDDIALIFHTSRTTSGIVKAVPETHE
jgi:hypothetical protein